PSGSFAASNKKCRPSRSRVPRLRLGGNWVGPPGNCQSRCRPRLRPGSQASFAASYSPCSARSIRCSSAEQRTATRGRTDLCMSIPPASRDANDAADRFHTTHWSLVAAAQDRASPEAQRALTELCEVYWYPLYAFIRRSGHGSEEARDLTQEFFARLL